MKSLGVLDDIYDTENGAENKKGLREISKSL